MLSGEISCTTTAFNRALEREIDTKLRYISSEVLDFTSSPRATDCCTGLVLYLKKLQSEISVLGITSPPSRKAESASNENETLIDLLRGEVRNGSLKPLMQSAPEITGAIANFVESMIKALEPSIHELAQTKPLATALVCMQGVRIFADNLWVEMFGPEYEGTLTAFASMDRDLQISGLSSIISILCSTPESLALLEKNLRAGPIPSKLEALKSEFQPSQKVIKDSIDLSDEARRAMPRLISNIKAVRDADQWAATASKYAGGGAENSAGQIAQELEFGACDTGVIFLGPKSNGDAAVVTFFRAIDLAIVTQSGSRGALKATLDANTLDGQPLKIDSQNFMFVDQLRNVFPEPLVKYSSATHVTGAVASQIHNCVARATELLGKLWDNQPRLFSQTQGRGPLYLVVKDPSRFLVVPSETAEFFSTDLSYKKIEQARCDRLSTAAGLEKPGGWTAFEIPAPKLDRSDGSSRESELSIEQKLHRYYKTRVGFPTYPQLVSLLRLHFDVRESRSEGKGSHGALFLEGDGKRTRFTTCTSIRGFSDPMKFHIILDVLEKLGIPLDQFLDCVK